MKKIYKNKHVRRKIKKIEDNKVNLNEFCLSEGMFKHMNTYDKAILSIIYEYMMDYKLDLKKSEVDIFEKRVKDFIKKDLGIIKGEETHDLIQYGVKIQLKNRIKEICKNILESDVFASIYYPIMKGE